MNENEINKNLPEGNPALNEERNEMTDIYMESAPQSPNLNSSRQPKEGVTFNWTNLLIGAFLFFGLFNGTLPSSLSFTNWDMLLWASLSGVLSKRCKCSSSRF